MNTAHKELEYCSQRARILLTTGENTAHKEHEYCSQRASSLLYLSEQVFGFLFGRFIRLPGFDGCFQLTLLVKQAIGGTEHQELRAAV